MKTLYIECNMGAAGDMLMAALLELLPEPDSFIHKMNHLGIPNILIELEQSVKCGITGTHVSVRIDGEEEKSIDVGTEHTHSHDHHHHHNHAEHAHHHHTGMKEIANIINNLPVSDKVKCDVLEVYGIIAEAESKAHGKPVDAIHFHEVGMMDAIADIVGVCLLMEELAPDRIVVSPVHVGCGQVKCAHGVLPVPAPATAYILKGVPIYGGQIEGELCTPTGAALLKFFADEFGDRPTMATESIGYGMGKKDFSSVNCVRTFIGECKQQESAGIVEIVCNLDDMTGEELGFAQKTLFTNGALDVYIIPIQMKKNRPGHMLVCLCNPEDELKMAGILIKHTTTFGVRSSSWRRYTLDRSIETVNTEYGSVRVKKGTGFGVNKAKAEYDDVSALAESMGISMRELKTKLQLW